MQQNSSGRKAKLYLPLSFGVLTPPRDSLKPFVDSTTGRALLGLDLSNMTTSTTVDVTSLS
jgi:hypothetical protein